jgi:hypothetical protein
LSNLKLKKLFAVEIAAVAIILVVIFIVVEVTPYLASANQNSQISIYTQKEFANGAATLVKGESASVRFNYTTYDPAILIVDLAFQSWQTPGNLSLYCNGRIIATIQATPDNPKTRLSTISVSGFDIVKSPAPNSFTYGNELTFVSDLQYGYEGDFNYQISIRGSR